MPRIRITTPDGHSREVPLAPGRSTLGRGADCTIPVDHSTLSRAHAAIEETGGGLAVVDLGSRNGVRAGGKTVARLDLVPGTKFTLGKVDFELLGEGPAPAPVPAPAPAPALHEEGDTDRLPDDASPRSPLLFAAAGLGGLAVAGIVLTLIMSDAKARKPERKPATARTVVQNADLPPAPAPEPAAVPPPDRREPAPAALPDPEDPRDGEVRVRFRDGTARVGKLLRRTKFEIEIAALENGAAVNETYPIEDVLRIGDETVRPDWDAVFRRRFLAAKNEADFAALDAWCRKYGWDKGRREILEARGAESPPDTPGGDISAATKQVRFMGRLYDPQELRADGRLDARGRLVLPDTDLRIAREFHFDLLGRAPTEAEVQAAGAETRGELADRLLRSVEHFEMWYEEELFYFLLLDNFHPATERLTSIPKRLSAGALTLPDAVHEIVISQYFNHRNPGNDTYVTVILEQLLGIVVQDQPMLLKVGKQMYDGYEGKLFNESGASQSDLVSIVLKQKGFHEILLQRLHRGLTGEAIPAGLLEQAVARVAADPKAFHEVQKEWLLGDDYLARAQGLRRKSDHQFIRSLYVDLLGRRPTWEEFRSFRNALQALADPTPIRSVLAKVMADSKEMAEPKASDAKQWVRDTFRKLVGRSPTESEVSAFAAAVEKGKARLAIQAIIDSEEYQHY
ncbi:MAG: FHA domain-containing protein [Planctomycetes bacterium]|nr:FHA domain-containing protein [Planctomycetota bacterium]